ncbi:MAG: SulP family inorganic anion transporter [Nocardioides sp.]
MWWTKGGEAGPSAARASWAKARDRFLLRRYERKFLAGDVSAGLLVAALAVPQALGYATVAGVPVQVGLYTLPPALFAYALLGSSRVLYVGPVSTVTVLSGSIVRQVSQGDPARAADLTSALAIVAGLFLVAAGLVKIGWIARFLNQPIVMGFVTGLVILIIVGEIPGVLGLPPPSGSLIERVWSLATSAPDANPTTFVIAAATLVVLFGGQAISSRVPWALLVLIGGIAASRWLELSEKVRVVGEVPSGVPLPGLPHLDLHEIGSLVTGGIAIAGVGIAEGLAAARTFAYGGSRLHDDEELLANGAADIASGLFGGMGVAGSLSKTAANARAGAHTQMSGAVSALAVLAVLIFATGLLAPLPRAVLSAIVIHAVWGLLKPHEFRRFSDVRRLDGLAALVALLGVLLLGPLNGLLVAVGQSLLGLVYRSMQVEVDVMGRVAHEKAAWGSVGEGREREQVPGVLVLRPNGPIFWANAVTIFDRARELIDEQTDVRAVLLDLEATNQLDTTAGEALQELIEDLKAQGIEVYLVRVFGNVREVLARCGAMESLGEGQMWRTISAGVKAAKKSPAFKAAGLDALTDEDVPDESADQQAEDEAEESIASDHGWRWRSGRA